MNIFLRHNLSNYMMSSKFYRVLSTHTVLKHSELPLYTKEFDYAKIIKKNKLKQKWQNLKIRYNFNVRLPIEQRQRVLVLGTGWGAINFIKHLDIAYYDIIIVSPRNYFTFTPLLPSVCAGTLAPRACIEPVRPLTMRGGKTVMDFYESWAIDINYNKNEAQLQGKDGNVFTLPYNYLVLAVGGETNTFNIPGVEQNAIFLKEVEHAREIRCRVFNLLEQAALPGIAEEAKKQLLHFVVVGGGPTGVEVAAELMDFIKEDAARYYPQLMQYISVTLVEMLPKLLPSFNNSISKFTRSNLEKMNINVLTETQVTEVTPKSIKLQNKNSNETSNIPCGFVLWASGIKQVPLIQKLMKAIPAQQNNKVLRVDENLRVHGSPLSSMFAIGDCSLITPEPLAKHTDCLYKEGLTLRQGPGITYLKKNIKCLRSRFSQLNPVVLQKIQHQKKNYDKLNKHEFEQLLKEIDSKYTPPPPTAQNANQEAQYLASVFNEYITNEDKKNAPAYNFFWKGSMAYVGNNQSVIELPRAVILGGKKSIFFWKGFYLTQQTSMTNRFLCLYYWYKAKVFGRDISRDHTLNGLRMPPK